MNPDNAFKAARLSQLLRRWMQQNPDWARSSPYGIGSLRSSQDVAASLLNEVEFGEVRLASLLESPDGRLVRTVVESLLPPMQRAEVDLLVEGVMEAARARRRGDLASAGVLTAASAAIALVVLLSVRPGGTSARR